MKIGLIQTNAIGDIIIALPIAQWYVDRGHEVFWPIDSTFIDMFQIAAPDIKFLPVEKNDGQFNYQYFLGTPKTLLANLCCDKVFILYSHLSGIEFNEGMKSTSLKFDEYKYSIAGVPFIKKWDLKINRNIGAEQHLLKQLKISKPYIVINEKAGPGQVIAEIPISDEIRENFQIIYIEPITKSIFDWIPVFENAAHIACFDSGPANLIDQLLLNTPKTLYLRSPALFTPVFASGWEFR
jgi:hypothetical protein